MTNTIFNWAIIGAGPAGIAAVGKLIDQGIKPSDILWLDPHFKVGDLGQFWRHVSSNTTVARFKDFLYAAKSFDYAQAEMDYELKDLEADDTCTLYHVVEPLQWVSNHLKQKVTAKTMMINRLQLTNRTWSLFTNSETYHAKNVILATGAVPISLSYPQTNEIPFEIAIDRERLSNHINRKSSYAVFGSSHSAIIVLRHLVELGVKKVINFYRSPCRYAIDMGNSILFDNTGLKGKTAEWARQYIDGELPANLVRYHANDKNIARFLPECDEVIYAVGFKNRNNITISHYENARYNPQLGIIGPGLFGLGIAYPEIKADPYNNVESQVGLWKFMVYLEKILPVWLKYTT